MRWKQIIWLCTVLAVSTKCASISGSQNVFTIEHFPDEFNKQLGNNSSQETNKFSERDGTDLYLETNFNISTQKSYTNSELKETLKTDEFSTTEAISSSNTLEVLNAIPSEKPDDSNVAYQSRWVPINISSDRHRVGDGDIIGGGNGVGGNVVGEDGVEEGNENGVEGGNENGDEGEGAGEGDGEGGNGNGDGVGGPGGGDGEDGGGVEDGGEGAGEGDGEGGNGDGVGGPGGGDGEDGGGVEDGGEGDGEGGNGNGDGGEGAGEGGNGNGDGVGGPGGGDGEDGGGVEDGGEDANGNGNGNGVENESVNTINTTSGNVFGYKWRNNENIISYIDIPYGQISSPFESSSRAVYNEQTHGEQEHKKWCPQIRNGEYTGELDCLTLSIFVPTEAQNASVLFHIHDPDIGSADPIVYGPEYIVSEGIILVLPNYRIGALGFLCLLNSTAPGNAGLKDLTLALQWVNENIQKFGGNPSNIVVSGDGTAGALVGYLTLSPSQHYIKRAITESGSALSPNALDRNPLTTAQHLAYKIRENDVEKELHLNNTFEEATVQDIVTAANDINLSPCVELDSNEEPFMNNTPWQILTNNKIYIDFMIGTASFAGTHEALALPEESIQNLNADFSQIFPDDLHFHNTYDRTRNGQTTKLQYFGESNITADNLEPLSLCFTDALYLGPGIRMARSLVASGATVYLYEFDFVGTLNKEIVRTSRPVSGAIRGDIVGYIFKQVDVPIEDDSSEQKMVNLMVNLWASFIKNGVPSAPDVKWPKFQKSSETEEAWLRIALEPNMTRGVHVDRLRLWTQLYENYYIERSFSVNLTPRDYVTYYAVTILLISFSKFNYLIY